MWATWTRAPRSRLLQMQICRRVDRECPVRPKTCTESPPISGCTTIALPAGQPCKTCPVRQANVSGLSEQTHFTPTFESVSTRNVVLAGQVIIPESTTCSACTGSETACFRKVPSGFTSVTWLESVQHATPFSLLYVNESMQHATSVFVVVHFEQLWPPAVIARKRRFCPQNCSLFGRCNAFECVVTKRHLAASVALV